MPEPTYSSPADDAFFAAVGRLAISWARIENGLDFTVIILHQSFDGDEVEPEIPWSLDRKIKFLRKCLGKWWQGQPAREKVLTLLTDIKTASETRHDILHGFAISHPEGAAEMQMSRFLRGGRPGEQKRFTTTTEQILQHAVDANALSVRAMEVASAFATVILKYTDESESKLPG